MNKLIRLLGLISLVTLLAWPGMTQASSSAQNATCTRYVDQAVPSDGNGSAASPWNRIASHVADLSPGDVVCIRGDVSGPGRVYDTEEINLSRNGTSSQPITLRPYPGEKVILRNNGNDDLLVFGGVDYWIVEGLILDNNTRADSTVTLKDAASHNILRDNEIYNGRANGINISRGSIGNTLENNHIHHFDASVNDAHCIVLSAETDNTIIRRNTIHDCSGDGIQLTRPDNLTPPDFPDNVQIIENVFYRGALARAENAIDIKAATNLQVIGNRMSGYTGDVIILQKASRNVLFDGNIIFDSGAGIDIHAEDGGRPEGVTFRNNLLHSIGGRGIQIMGVANGTFVHNTIVQASDHAILIAGAGLTDGMIRNNLIVESGSVKLRSGSAFQNVLVGYNGWFNTIADSVFKASTDKTGQGDPGFLNATAQDYHLTVDSPARDAGFDVGVRTDSEGDPRPFGCQPDLGADEYMPILCLAATGHDRTIRLNWTDYENPALASYAILYTYGPGGRKASQGPSPILNIPTTVRTYTLTEVANYAFYTVTIVARDGNNADLAVSNSVRVMPTDIFIFMPAIHRW